MRKMVMIPSERYQQLIGSRADGDPPKKELKATGQGDISTAAEGQDSLASLPTGAGAPTDTVLTPLPPPGIPLSDKKRIIEVASQPKVPIRVAKRPIDAEKAKEKRLRKEKKRARQEVKETEWRQLWQGI